VYLERMTAHYPGGPRLCQVITRVPAATWWMLRLQPMLTVVPFGVVRHLVDAGQLAVLRMREPMPFEPLGMLLPLQDVHAAAARMAEFLTRFAAAAAPLKKERKARAAHGR
jgi:hypothetical protein